MDSVPPAPRDPEWCHRNTWENTCKVFSSRLTGRQMISVTVNIRIMPVSPLARFVIYAGSHLEHMNRREHVRLQDSGPWRNRDNSRTYVSSPMGVDRHCRR